MGHRSGTASQHIHFVPVAPEGRRKHYTYEVRSLTSGERLGTVHIYPRWYGWVLEPAPDTIWSGSCLDLVRDFIRARNSEMRRGKREPSR